MRNNSFIKRNFLLHSSTAEQLYYEFAADLPIIDYHNHLPPNEIAQNRSFSNITQLWLNGDHYKWRAMRANGIEEKYITGDESDLEKFKRWAATVPYTIRNPLYHWAHLELLRYFQINDLLDSTNAEEIYSITGEHLQQPDYHVQGLLKKMKVEVICTTDHPTDSLEHHEQLMNTPREFKMLPTFRPDKFLDVRGPDFLNYLNKLGNIEGSDISTFDQLVAALRNRIDFFDSLGCRLSDHGLAQLHDIEIAGRNYDSLIQKRKENIFPTMEESFSFQMALLHELCLSYHEKGWTTQIHLGAIRNNNSRLKFGIGADAGADSIGDYDQARGLSVFLDRLDTDDKLTNTILYNLNPRDNEVFATMAGNFNDGRTPGKIQWGSAWWFLDQKDGMEKQLNTLSSMGLLSRFIGMLTDSRSFMSFPRHEYFRRILCNLIGSDVDKGELPNDISWLGQIVEQICYQNARQYFNF